MVLTGAEPGAAIRRAAFGGETPSHEVRTTVDRILATRNNAGAPFFVVDKRRARLFVFEPDGRLRGAAPVLLGLARGDDSAPGVGERTLDRIRPHERTTPAGRFVAERGVNLKGEDIVWVDYDAAVSLHRMRSISPAERRLERLLSPTPADNRISYGCINVPPRFYDEVVDPAWKAGRGVVVYVLPEVKPLDAVFESRRRQ